MKLKGLVLTAMAASIMSCKADVSAPNIGFQVPQEDTSYPKFLFQDIQGTVYGQTWVVQTGIVRNFSDGPKKEIMMYAEVPANPCSEAFVASKPFVSYVLPENFTTEDYRTDMNAPNGNNPAVFNNLKTQDQYIIAEKTRVVINAINAADMSISFYAIGSDDPQAPSEINGSYIVKFCP